MERRLNKKVEEYLIQFKNEIAKRLQNIVDGLEQTNSQIGSHVSLCEETKFKCNSLAGFVYNYEKLRLTKDDFMKRKRIKSVVPIYDRCCAKRANGEQCTRRKKGVIHTAGLI